MDTERKKNPSQRQPAKTSTECGLFNTSRFQGKDADGVLGLELTTATGASSCSLYTSCVQHVACGPRAVRRILNVRPDTRFIFRWCHFIK